MSLSLLPPLPKLAPLRSSAMPLLFLSLKFYGNTRLADFSLPLVIGHANGLYSLVLQKTLLDQGNSDSHRGSKI